LTTSAGNASRSDCVYVMQICFYINTRRAEKRAGEGKGGKERRESGRRSRVREGKREGGEEESEVRAGEV